VEFNNSGYVNLGVLVGGWFPESSIEIEGINSKRILNLIIKQGIFI
jgi:hypothetical protein